MDKVRLSVRLKFVFINFLIILLFGTSTMVIVFSKIKTSNLDSMNMELNSYSTMLAKSADIKKVKSIIEKPDESNPTVLEISKQMDEIMEDSKSNIANLYLVTYRDGHIYFPTMSSSLVTNDFTFGSEYSTGGSSFNDPVKVAFESQSIQTTEIYSDQFGTWKSGFHPITDESGNVIALYAVDFDVSKVNQKAWDETKSLLIMVFFFLIISGIIVYIVVTRMTKPIVNLSNASQQIADGDLTIEEINITTKDELGLLGFNFNQMVRSLRGLIQQVSENAEQVAASSEELTASAEQTSHATTQIATAIQEVASGAETQGQGAEESSRAMKEMNISIQRVAEMASSVSEAATESTREANRGNEAIQKVIRQMNAINVSVDHSASVIKQLGERSKEIGKIIEVITGIANQTNLLALNAAIEAARAGEHGRGFTVVADEVRKLAEQSKESADQIAGLIQQIQGDTARAVTVMEKGTNEVAAGMTVVQETGEGFQRILKSIEEVSTQIQEVSAVSEEMSASVEQVSASIEEMARIAQDSASNTQNVASSSEEQLASMEEISSSASSLSKMAEELQMLIRKFKV